jgi:hypothetical protein
MKPLATLAVCLAVLYGVDSVWFNGRYSALVDRVIFQVHACW